MKQVLLFAIIFLASCKKETPTPLPETTQAGRPIGTTVTPPELSPLMFINGALFNQNEVGINRDYIVSIENSSSGATIGTVTFYMAKPAVFTTTFNPVSHISNVLGGIQNNNSDFTFTDAGQYYEVTCNVVIPANSNKIVGFQIKRNPNISPDTSENIWVSITQSSGGDVDPLNNNTSLYLIAQ